MIKAPSASHKGHANSQADASPMTGEHCSPSCHRGISIACGSCHPIASINPLSSRLTPVAVPAPLPRALHRAAHTAGAHTVPPLFCHWRVPCLRTIKKITSFEENLTQEQTKSAKFWRQNEAELRGSSESPGDPDKAEFIPQLWHHAGLTVLLLVTGGSLQQNCSSWAVASHLLLQRF